MTNQSTQENPQRYEGKVALITGGGTGIGAAIAAQMASEGASIAICGRREQILHTRAKQWRSQGYNVLPIVADVATDAPLIIRQVLNEFGHLDVLVNNAATTAGSAIEDMTYEKWQQVTLVNLTAAFDLVYHARPHLVIRKGNILHISSISAISGNHDDVAYAASKAGLEGFSRKLALELAPDEVRSNVIRPGLILTEAFANMPQDFFDSQVPLIPLGRIGQPSDIARAAAFICSSDAQFITGAVLTIDGGESAK
ncbi:MAG: SDR family NAD(P)-dependent oxidoreductase [Chloroflexota bacterium]